MKMGGGRRALDLYEKLEKVREGRFGKVYRAREKATGQIVELKKTWLPEDDKGVPPTVMREVSLLRMLSQDPHVVRLLHLKQGFNKEGQTIFYLVFEYMDTDLKKFIRGHRSNREKIPAATVKILMYQLCKGVAFVHGRGVLHRDLKPRNNLLMDCKTMALKIADLSLSRAIIFRFPGQTCTHEVGLEPHGWYRAPEILLGATHYYMPADIWSVGCIFLYDFDELRVHFSMQTASEFTPTHMDRILF
ncbi:cyclin-dependent kinase B2-1-like [Miscanthus floridulus]|uniref:cyclin-dependent kinase B2-1-like n=1 Tax=Miscanthus floridulus TaxID=154761 RepID=UPI0034584DC0